MEEKISSPSMIVLVGAPGTAKLKLASELSTNFKDWVVISQTKLGSRYECVKAVHEAITEGKSTIIARCNINSFQRRTWIKIAKQRHIPVDCLELRVPYKILEERLLERETHPRGLVGTKALEVLSNFKNKFEPSKVQEGFNNVVVLPAALQKDCNFGPNTWSWLTNAFSFRLDYTIPTESSFISEPVELPQNSKSLWKEAGYIRKNRRKRDFMQSSDLIETDNNDSLLISEESILSLLGALNIREISECDSEPSGNQ